MSYSLYVITDEELSKGLSHTEIARLAVEGGADVVQLRDKKKVGRELLRQALEIRGITKKAGRLFIVNDRLDIAIASKADGVHLGQQDLPAEVARPLCPEGFIIGVSASTLEEARRAEKDGADYVGFGPVCATASKKDAAPACGFNTLRIVCDSLAVPVVAIGGINHENAAEAVMAGADGVAVISAVVSSDDVREAAKSLKSIVVGATRRKVYE